jgi:hypothetical protein
LTLLRGERGAAIPLVAAFLGAAALAAAPLRVAILQR